MPNYNDGDVPYGLPGTAELYDSPEVNVFLGNYVVESITIDEGSTVIERHSGDDVMSGRVVIEDSASSPAGLGLTGSARLQRAAASTPAPQIGNGLLIIFSGTATGDYYHVVTGVTQTAAQADAQTFDARFAQTSLEY